MFAWTIVPDEILETDSFFTSKREVVKAYLYREDEKYETKELYRDSELVSA